ncbi:LysE family translocator [Helicobacter mastomyrinus]|uniref:LysE family translocator n=2 Tax=Helicobacter TaxID=209 RepID=A0ABZ3F2M3_9HELI|nr:LysE family translocator [uncultured Helicobacter sp.]
MEYIEKVILLCLMGFFAAITPGPDILLTLKVTLRFGILQGFKVLLGIASGWIVYLGIIYLGLVHWLNTSIMQFCLSFIGGSYLLYLGFIILSSTPQTYALESADSIRKDGFWQGLILNLSNPKAILFFIFLVTPFINEDIKIGLIALWCSLFSAFVCVIICGSVARAYINARMFMIIDRICGICFVCFAWLLFFECGELGVRLFVH